jgi:hypothetical protein
LARPAPVGKVFGCWPTPGLPAGRRPGRPQRGAAGPLGILHVELFAHAFPQDEVHKGLKKRFKVTANGKVLHKPCGSSHLNSHKSGKKIRRLRRAKP